jgi:hypothetical protein
VPTPNVTLSVVETPCPPEVSPNDPANACTQRGAYTIWMDPVNGSRERFLHELGHNFDYYQFGKFGSRRFRAILDDERPWRTNPGDIGLSPHEIFAEAYSVCALKPRIKRAMILLPPISIGPRQHRLICALIGRS